MKKLPIVEVVMGAVLLISVIGFYSLQQNGDKDAQKSTTASSENNSESGQLIGSDGQPYTLAVREDKSVNMDITDKMDYYSKKVYITEENFLNQQYGNIGDTVFWATLKANSLNYTPASAKVTNIKITNEISDEYMNLVDKKVSRAQKSGSLGWNCFVRNFANMDDTVTKEKAESLSSYVIADVALTNYTDNEIIINLSSLNMPVIEDNGVMSSNTYSESVNKDYVSRAGDGNNYVLLEMDKPVDYVGMISSVSGTPGVSNSTYYHEPDPSMAFSESEFYLAKGELKLKLLYVITDKELATGKVCFCGGNGTEGISTRYSNNGFRIRINQGASNEGNN